MRLILPHLLLGPPKRELILKHNPLLPQPLLPRARRNSHDPLGPQPRERRLAGGDLAFAQLRKTLGYSGGNGIRWAACEH